ncbi:MAG: response regulator [Chloroflexi bacterium]|nr:response regulator [Chloroflexota bacterium]
MKPCILVIEDDPAISEIISTVLTAEGFEVHTAESGQDGLRFAVDEQPSLIILDVNLPDGSGLEICRQLHQQVNTASIPVIVLTAQSGRSAKLAAFEFGADDYITKPFDIEELIARVRTQLRHAEQWRLSELTGLPGNRQIERAIHALVNDRRCKQKWAILYCDLDNFKSYNDVYGFVAGNELITAAAELLTSAIHDLGLTPGLDFVGHIGGDDFVVITAAETAEPLARELIRRFDAMLPRFYPESARERGYIEAKNRQGVEQKFPLVTLSIGIVTNSYRMIDSVESVGNLAAEVKRKAKAQPHSAYCIDRRRVPASVKSGGERSVEGAAQPVAVVASRIDETSQRTSQSPAGEAMAATAPVRNDVESAYFATARGMASAVESKDSYTANHIERVSAIAIEIAKELGITGPELRGIELGAILHDLGKICIDSKILTKPGPLTPAEFAEMMRHPVVGSEMLGESPYLSIVRDCVRHHHEHYDGRGYPDGLAGESIPLFARIVSVADAYDAMTSDRCYRRRLPPERALSELQSLAGQQWDPTIVDVFARIHDRLLTTAA